jgi:hypothetical protein
MQNDKNNYNDFLHLVYAPPVYKLTLKEIEVNLNLITNLLKNESVLTEAEVLQLKQYRVEYMEIAHNILINAK